ncbi:ankyrin repeat domain-containing protein [Neolewinella persica]|uniref:ankyrin repeat domain-containing protein n=1 Tax=Neolewinella persica TaxID=70998 RepID=UPI0003715921|nr:ankyrin repeat domain-containing protein [Neolewinella persica]
MIEQFFSPELIHALGWTLVHSLWQGALFAVALGLLLVLLRKFSARARYNVAIGMLCAFFLTASLSFYQLYVGTSEAVSVVLPASQPEVQPEVADSALPIAAKHKPNLTSVAPAPIVSASFRERFVNYYNHHLPLIVTLWLMGVLVLQLRFLGQLAYVQRLKNYGTERFPAKWAVQIQELETRLNISRPVRYLTSFRVNSPLTLGWLNPVVLFPPGLLAELKASQVVTILAHELAHVKRNDFMVNLVQTLLCTLFFFHPATWWMSARINEEREHCCDDLAIDVTGEAVGYAKTLLRMKEEELKRDGVLTMAFRGKEAGGFNYRIRRLVSGYLNGATYGEGLVTALILVAALGTAVAASDGDQAQVLEPEPVETEMETSPEEDVIASAVGIENAEMPATTTDALNTRRVSDEEEREDSGAALAYMDWAATDGKKVANGALAALPDSLEFPFLMEAIDDGNYDLVKYFLSKNVNVNQTDRNGWTPLMVAASEDHVRIVRLLINAGADVNYVNRRGWTALIEAADEGATASARVLLGAGAKTDLPGTSRSAADMAASEGHPDILRMLVGKGADLSGLGRTTTPLHQAAEEGQLNIVKSLIEGGADAGAGDEDGRAALHYAAAEGKTEVVRYLLEKGADPNKGDNEGRGPLAYAAEEGKLEVIRLLRANGAAVAAADQDGRTPIHYAAHEGKLSVVEMLLENGGTANVGDHSGRTPLHYAAKEGDDDMVRLLLANGAVANARDRNGHTALDMAIDELIDATDDELRHANIKPGENATITTTTNGPDGKVIRLLTQAGATSSRMEVNGNGNVRITVDDDHGFYFDSSDGGTSSHHDVFDDGTSSHYDSFGDDENEVNAANEANEANIPNRNGSSSGEPLVSAVRKGENYKIDLLISGGANVDGIGRNGRTPLTEASFHNYNVHTGQLVKGGADINKRDAEGYTPLTMAVQHNNFSTVDLLLELGADPNLKDGNDLSAKDISLRDNYPEILRLLNDAGGNVTGVEHNGTSPLEVPARDGHLGSLRYLLEQGADPNAGSGCPPVFLAAREGHLEAIRLLARNKANLEKGCDYRDTDFYYRAVPGGGGSVADYQGPGALMVALTQTDATAVSALLDGGANVNATCRKARYNSPREISWRESENLRKEELASRFDMQYDVSGWTPLMEAVESNRLALVQLLLKAGANKNLVAGGGLSARSLAKEIGNPDIITALR